MLFKPTGLRPQLLERNHGIPEEERRKRLEMRTRLRRRKIQNSDGLSLADRILIQRREVSRSSSVPPVFYFRKQEFHNHPTLEFPKDS